jgi:hypothetical protein
MEEIDRLHQEFPDLDIRDLGYGANLYTRLGTITIYWEKKRKYCINNEWKQYYDFEGLLTTIAEYLHVPKPKDAQTPLNEATDDVDLLMSIGGFQMQHEIAKEQLEAYCEHRSKQGVQNCINHINRKIEFAEKNGLSTSNRVMLKTLVEELNQYL